MKLDQVMKALARAGTARNRTVYARHGAQEPMFGVGYATLYGLQQRIGVDHALARALWDTRNHDARVLATLVADGESMTAAELQRWQRAADHRFLAMAFSALAARCRAGLACALRWIDGKREFEQAAGWGTLAGLTANRAIGDEVFAPLLPRLEKGMHELPNYARYAANNCLIAIGSRPGLQAEAMRVARAIGRVVVDHGDSSCKTPVAAEYIDKMRKRPARRTPGTTSRTATGREPAGKPAKARRRGA